MPRRRAISDRLRPSHSSPTTLPRPRRPRPTNHSTPPRTRPPRQSVPHLPNSHHFTPGLPDHPDPLPPSRPAPTSQSEPYRAVPHRQANPNHPTPADTPSPMLLPMIATDQILRDARRVRFSHVALTAVLFPFWGLGWLAGHFWLGLVVCAISIRRGWRDGTGYIPPQPSESQSR
jgi:hypothetical protein